MATYTWTPTDAQDATLTRQLALVNRMRRQADPLAANLTATEYLGQLLATACIQWRGDHSGSDGARVRDSYPAADAATRAEIRRLLNVTD